MNRLPVRRDKGRPRSTARRPSLECLESKTLMARFVVSLPTDPDVSPAPVGTLRSAIERSNEQPGPHTIEFNLPANQRVITLNRALEPINTRVTIDGTTQPGYLPQDTTTMVQVTFGPATGSADAFELRAPNSAIRALSITGFRGDGIRLVNASRSEIQNNLIGVTPQGAPLGNTGHGVYIENSSRVLIGGEVDRGNRISNNGTATQSRNGVTIVDTTGPQIASIENQIQFNSFLRNSGIGIDLGNDGPTPNATTNAGPNRFLNAPVIASAVTIDPVFGAERTQVSGSLTLTNRPNTMFTLQFFVNPSNARQGALLEGGRLVAVQTDDTGTATFTTSFFGEPVDEGNYVTATATDPQGNTSEFSAPVQTTFTTDRVDLGISVVALNQNLVPVVAVDRIDAGFPLTYVATVRNFNPNGVASDRVVVLIDLPAGVSLDESSLDATGGGTFEILGDGDFLRVTFDPIASEAFETFSFDVVPLVPGFIVADFAIVEGPIADPRFNNNQASVTTQVTLNETTSILSFRVRDFAVGESGGFATIEVEQRNFIDGNQPRTIEYRTLAGGSAVPGVDYEPRSGILTFQPGQVLQTFQIPIIDNDLFQPNRTVFLELFNAGPTPGAIPGIDRATLTIFDNDPQPFPPQFLQFAQGQIDVLENAGQVSIVVQRVGGVAGIVSIPFTTVAGTALPGRDFSPVSGTLTFLSGESEKTIVVPIINNDIVDGNLSFGVNLGAGTGAASGNPSSVLVTIVDDESPLVGTFQFSMSNFTAVETDGTATITVTRQGGTGSATVGYATSPGTAVPGVRYQPVSGTLEFAEGETEKTFTVPVFETEGFTAPQTVLLNLAVPEGGSLGGNGQATLTIVDNEEAPASIVQFTTGEIVVDETVGMAMITINRLGLPIGTVSVNVFTAAGDAVPGVHYQPINTVVEFGPGETSKTVAITIINNNVFDSDRAVGIFLSDPAGNVLLGQPDSQVLVIRNTDPDPIVPFVADVLGVGPGGSINAISLGFNKTMDASTLLRPTNYSVVAHGRDGVLGTADDRVITIAGLEVAPGGLGVTVILATPVPAGQFVSIGVNGFEGGLADTSGNLLDGDGDGLAGGNFSTTLGRSSRITYRDFDGDLITYVVTGGGFVEVVRGTPGSGDIVRITNPVPGRSVLRGQVTRRPGGDGLAFIRRIEGIDPFGLVRSSLRTPPFVDFSQITPEAVDALLASRRGRPARR